MVDIDEKKDFDAAVATLTGLIKSHYRPKGSDAEQTFAKLPIWLERLGLTVPVAELSVIHVAGTKGKGSTCAFAERILRECGHRTGLFTSPHLLDIRERIRIDGEPVSREAFAEHFWWCFDRLQRTCAADLGVPPYFYLLTIVALRVFAHEQVDVAVLEVGLGGRLDATNVVPAPVVCGISSLGLDHQEVLGATLALIAREKAGVLKRGVPAFSAAGQLPEAAEVLLERANQVQAPLRLPPPLPAAARLSLAGDHQRLNAELAVALCAEWSARARPDSPATAVLQRELAAGRLPAAFAAGLADTQWPGRGQVVRAEPALTWFLDGAHTGESTAVCARWFAEASAAEAAAAGPAAAEPERVLLFNCLQERDPARLLGPIDAALRRRGLALQHALFCPSDSVAFAAAPDLRWQHATKATWEALQGAEAAAARPPSPTAVLPSLQAAMAWLGRRVREVHPRPVHVLATGSLYLVGDLLRLLKAAPK